MDDSYVRRYQVGRLKPGLRGMYLVYAVIFVVAVLGTVHDGRGCANCESPLLVTAIFGATFVVIIAWCECVAIAAEPEAGPRLPVVTSNWPRDPVRSHALAHP